MNALPTPPGPPPGPPPTANDRFKASFRSRLWASLIAATLAHFALFGLWPDMVAEDLGATASAIEILEVPPPVEIPPPPAPLVRPAVPIPAVGDVDVEVMPPNVDPDGGFPPLPPPPPAAGRDLSQGPVFVPRTLEPRLLNPGEVVQAMARSYPPLLREAGIGGTVRIHFLVGVDGTVRDTRLQEGSGHAALDRAALEVAGVYRFAPAMNRDDPVAVWISLPVTFQVRQERLH